ncbi:MAG: DUF222 domain-containing protein [Actinomycetota bacterium]
MPIGILAACLVLRDVSGVDDEIESLHRERCRLAAREAELFRRLELSGLYCADGHGSAKTMVRHVGKLSGATAARQRRIARVASFLPLIAEALAESAIGVDQVDLLGRVAGNGRVRHLMPDAQTWFLEMASESFDDFERTVREWERLADQDGPEPNDRMHRARRVTLTQNDETLTWQIDGRFGSLLGAQIAEIFEHYTAAELAADWEKARAERGDEACDTDLPRTHDQRTADALWQVFQDAAAADASCVPPGFCHDVVWSAEAYEEMIRRLDGELPRAMTLETFRCETSNGTSLEPYEAAAQSLLTAVRRVIVDASSTVIDLGRARTFTGNARVAAKLQSTHCIWKGCRVPVHRCQVDHTRAHAHDGRTSPGNGAPMCGRHNRLKEHGFHVWRDPAGAWHLYRPDGTEIE